MRFQDSQFSLDFRCWNIGVTNPYLHTYIHTYIHVPTEYGSRHSEKEVTVVLICQKLVGIV